MMGYNSLAQAAPKAILDGAVLAMLVGRARRWRTLALLGPVYGLVLMLQTGIVYLPPIMTLASIAAAVCGYVVSRLHRLAAVACAAVVFELLAGAGRPLHIYFGTGGGNEPLLWVFYFLEWPLRVGGALVGVWIGWRFRPNPDAITTSRNAPATSSIRRSGRRTHPAVLSPATKLCLAMVGCVVPMFVEPWWALGTIAAGFIAFGLLCGLRWGLIIALIGLAWVWVMYSLASYLWHQDMNRVVDLLRTVVLRFAPLTCSAAVIMGTLRPVQLVRVLRRWRLSPVIVLPLATSLRALPAARRRMTHDLATLRASREWRGPLTPLIKPHVVVRRLFVPQFHHFASQLVESRDAPASRSIASIQETRP